LTERRGNIGYPRRAGLSPHTIGWVALALEGMICLAISIGALFALWGLFGDQMAAWFPFLSPAAWSTLIAVVLLKLLMPWVYPLTRRLSRCPACDKPTLLTSPGLDEWDLRANPDGHVAGQRRFRPEGQCSQCHADLHKAG
jgi:hypothetical protein